MVHCNSYVIMHLVLVSGIIMNIEMKMLLFLQLAYFFVLKSTSVIAFKDYIHA